MPPLRGPASPVGQDRGRPIFGAAASPAAHVAVPEEERGGEVGVVDSGRRDARDRRPRAST